MSINVSKKMRTTLVYSAVAVALAGSMSLYAAEETTNNAEADAEVEKLQ